MANIGEEIEEIEVIPLIEEESPHSPTPIEPPIKEPVPV